MKTYIYSTFWLYLSRFLGLAINLIMAGALARYLAPSGYGEYTYIVTLGVLFLFLANFGLDTIGVKEYVVDKNRLAEILYGQLFLRFFSGVFSFFVSFIVLLFWVGWDETFLFVLFVAFGSCIFPSVVFESYFYALSRGFYIGVSKIFSMLFFLILNLAAIKLRLDFLYFVVIVFFEMVIYFCILIFGFYKYNGGFPLFSINVDYVVCLVKKSWPLALSAGLVVLYNRVDVIMLEYYIGSSSVGIYSAGVKLSEATAFIPIIFLNVIFPYVISVCKARGDSERKRIMEVVIGAVFLIGLVSVFCTWYLADYLVDFIYGKEYEVSSEILRISIVAIAFSNIAVAGTQWLIMNDLQIYRLLRGGQTLLLNVVLNLILIPEFGVLGAAYSTIISQIVACYFGYCISKKTWPLVSVISRGVLLYPIISEGIFVLKNRDFSWNLK